MDRIDHPGRSLVAVAYDVGCDEDADFIAHARTDVPALVAALRAVIGLHRIIRVGGAGGVTYEVCQNCNQPAPCTYIQAIRQHLGEDD
nr:MAG TPA: hypothetical protein [Caudoviricetes sp.]